MQWRDLGNVIAQRPFTFIVWLTANLGGIIVAYAAALTIWGVQGHWGTVLPRPDVYLVTATVSLAMAGISYQTIRQAAPISPWLSFLWPFPLALVYGVFVAMGVKAPSRDEHQIWLLVLGLAAVCWIFSALIWHGRKRVDF